MAFIFGGRTNISGPDELKRRRDLSAAVMAYNNRNQPKNLWEGLNSLATSVGERNQMDRFDAAETEGKASASASFAPIVEALQNKGRPDNSMLVGSMGNDWLSDSQRDIASILLKQNMETDAPLTKWQQAQLDKDKEITPYQDRYLRYLESKGGDESAKFSLNPVWAKDAEGNWHLFQPNQGGGDPARVNFPEGVQPQPQVNFLDTGTSYEPRATKGGAPVAAPITKDVAGEAAEREIGKGQGAATSDYTSIKSKMPGLEKVVSDLDDLSNKATYTAAGQLWDEVVKQTGFEPREAAVARSKYIATVDNQVLPLLVDTFGAQFTVVEGQTLRATLGDPNKTPQEKQAVLKAFIEQKRRDVEALGARAGQGGAPKRLKFNSETGDLE